MINNKFLVFFCATALFFFSTAAHAETQGTAHKSAANKKTDNDGTHALSMYGDIKYSASFSHFDYVNPSAPKGGTLKRHSIGSFDSFNPFIAKGASAAGLGYLGSSHIWDSLTVQSLDEPFTAYGLVAERMKVSADKSTVTFYLRKEARFADGHPLTAEDVHYTFTTLKEKGRPFYSYYYGSVQDVKIINPYEIRFILSDTQNRELPLIIGQLPVLPKHHYQKQGFEKADLEKPLGSGPYQVKEFSSGKRIVYALREDYWAKNLAVTKGQNNFSAIIYEYFLDETVALEAFKGGSYNYRAENSAKNWATAYNSPALKAGTIIQEEITHSRPTGMQGFVFNLRRPMFQDKVLRQAINFALDFEWSNENLFYSQYSRTRSYFQNSDMEAKGLPDNAELAILNQWREQLPKEVFTQEYQPPSSKGPGGIRGNLRKAQKMLLDAGYSIKNNQLFTPSGEPVTFEILLLSALFERIALPFTRNLKILGIQANVRKIDSAQYIERMRHFDFDMVIGGFAQSSSPGNEQRDYWSSEAAERPDSRNIIGIKDPIVDELIELLIQSNSREELITRCRALDRVLQWGYYLVPNWHISRERIAYNHTLAHPDTPPKNGLSIDLWWLRETE